MESVADNVNELIKKQPTLNKYILKTIIMENKIYKIPGSPFIKYLTQYLQVGDCEGYGLNRLGEWTTCNFGLYECEEASIEEWNSTLISEANKRFKKGDVIKKLFGFNAGNPTGEGREVLSNEFYCHYADDKLVGIFCDNLKLFEEGVWATVI